MNINGKPVSASDLMRLVTANQLPPRNSVPMVFQTERTRSIPIRKWQKRQMHEKARGA